MIEIKYKTNSESTDVAGRTVAEARESYRQDFNITEKASAFLNGKKITKAGEASTILNDEDRLVFKKSGGNRLAFMVGALALAMTITGGIFAYGFINSSATINVTSASTDFASVTANTSSSPSWSANGMQKSQTGSGTLFDIDTLTSGYPGDFTVTISFGNSDDLIKVYRTLALNIEVRDSANNIMDINEDGNADSSDCTLLTLDNSRVTLSITQTVPDTYTVKLKNGFFMCNVSNNWAPGAGAPMLYCEIAQK